LAAEIRIFRKPLITPEPEVEKFQKWAEMKVTYPTDQKNIHKDFSNNFHNIENFVQVDHLKKRLKNLLIFTSYRFRKTDSGRKNYQVAKMNSYRCQII
jgi:hypothetical protein